MRRTTWYMRPLLILFLLGLIIYAALHMFNDDIGLSGDNELSNNEKLSQMSELIKSQKQQLIIDGMPACKLPDLDVNNPEILKFVHNVPPLECSPEDWVVVQGSKLILQDKIKKQFGPILCAFREIIRVDEYVNKLTEAETSSDTYILKYSDFADVQCEAENSGTKWHSVLAGVQFNPEVQKTSSWKNVPNDGLKLNVLMFGFDSLSRNTFIRKLPKTYDYLKENLKSQILEGYNIIGDGTPQALIPLLTGKTELELPDTRKRTGYTAKFVDVYPFIWQKYKQKGYITGFAEDVHHIGTFTYRLKGFKKQPTDHYMRPYYIAASPYFQNSKKYCLGSQPRHMIMMNYIKNIFNVYRNKPKFMFGFHGELSHDSYNDIGVADDDLYNWIKELQAEGHLNNTILIMMSDHGQRFADIRNTLAGKQEERLPFFSFTFPHWFKQVYPEAYANFVFNTRHLSTPFDIHKTLESILKLDPPSEGDTNLRDISLFNKIPVSRTCADAFIEPHWCACLSWKEIPTTEETVIGAANNFIKFINSYTLEHRDICEILKLDEIIWSARLIPTDGILKFQKTKDKDGFIGDFSSKTQLVNDIYQIKVKTMPGEGLFEVSVSHDVVKNIFNTQISDVSRINKYGSQARCVENEFYHLRKYCFCKD
ncbi:hypothetical protein HCN44_009293 [Aphidius gifuensis]|uniref:Uncharacterized protein n=1 Tax=Aphidius gifuensis TaxID=684658 RepID=A0A835CYQ0_APHGI|nr:uncharacterized protein LOC122859229 [Aphidius gifuensis]KAF7997895.1 hypothetical protein HCN44_009293 [Aphidius gifuensis]